MVKTRLLFLIVAFTIVFYAGAYSQKSYLYFAKDNISVAEAKGLVDLKFQEPSFPIKITNTYSNIEIIKDSDINEQVVTVFYEQDNILKFSYVISNFTQNLTDDNTSQLVLNDGTRAYYFNNGITQTIFWSKNDLFYRLNYIIGNEKSNLSERELVNIVNTIIKR